MNIDRIISIIRTLKEDGAMGVVASPPTNNISSGNIAKYDPVMSFGRRRRPTIIGKGKYPGARKRWSER
jgi:hypothetical protein